MGEFELRGPTAEADLERLLTQSIAGSPSASAATATSCATTAACWTT